MINLLENILYGHQITSYDSQEGIPSALKVAAGMSKCNVDYLAVFSEPRSPKTDAYSDHLRQHFPSGNHAVKYIQNLIHESTLWASSLDRLIVDSVRIRSKSDEQHADWIELAAHFRPSWNMRISYKIKISHL